MGCFLVLNMDEEQLNYINALEELDDYRSRLEAKEAPLLFWLPGSKTDEQKKKMAKDLKEIRRKIDLAQKAFYATVKVYLKKYGKKFR